MKLLQPGYVTEKRVTYIVWWLDPPAAVQSTDKPVRVATSCSECDHATESWWVVDMSFGRLL